MSQSLKPAQARLQACANLRCHVLGAEHPNSDVTKMNHAYAAVVDCVLRRIITKRLYADGMCQTERRPSLYQRRASAKGKKSKDGP